MIKPNLLKKGDKVALVSLSGGLGGEELFKHRVDLGIKRLEEIFGFEVVIAPNALKGCDFLSKHPEAKASDLMWAIKDDSIKGIFSIIGGTDSIKILPYLDVEEIAKHPKVFCGFSDSTSVHFMFLRAGVQSFYGPCVMCQFAENVKMHDYTLNAINHALIIGDKYNLESSPSWCGAMLNWADANNDNILRPMQRETHGLEFLKGKSTQGELIGGCIDVLPEVISAGLFDGIQWQDKILFLEPSDECVKPNVLRSYFKALKGTNIFDKINGVIFGKPKYEKYYTEYKTVLMEELKDYDINIVYNVNFGHEDPITVLPYGALLTIDNETKTLTVDNFR